MSRIVIDVENLSKVYRLGQIGTGTLTNDLKVWWAKTRHKPNPLLKVGQPVHGNRDGETLWALKDVNFKVEQGDVLGIIGRNGAGKSTLLKILSRVTAPSSGRIKVKGRIASLLEVGTGFHPDLTGRENIHLNGAILGMTKKEVDRKFDEIVDFAEIAQFIDTPVKRYSSGMYVRLAFAVAAHLDPEILVIDEVLAVGDVEFQKKCLGKMGDVAKKGRTVLFVSHNMAAVQNLCAKGILLESGTIASAGPVEDVIGNYLARAHQAIQVEKGDLTDWADRSGNGRAKITRFDVLDRHGNSVHDISFHDTVRFRITCYFPETMDATFGVLIHSTTEMPLIDLRSSNDNLKAEKLLGQVVVEAEVDALNLYPGDYYISPWIADRMIKEDIDFVHYCVKLKVTMLSRKNKFLKLDPTWGKFVVNSKWSVK
jgi:lipopolysaccharide transport system ATP-binding protein